MEDVTGRPKSVSFPFFGLHFIVASVQRPSNPASGTRIAMATFWPSRSRFFVAARPGAARDITHTTNCLRASRGLRMNLRVRSVTGASESAILDTWLSGLVMGRKEGARICSVLGEFEVEALLSGFCPPFCAKP